MTEREKEKLIREYAVGEVTQNFAKLGVDEIVQWARQPQGQVEIVPTTVFSAYRALRAMNPRVRSNGRGARTL